MNPTEKLEAAIAKLELLREGSTQPTGGVAWYQGRDSRRYEWATEVYTGPDENAPGSADVITVFNPFDAELIVTLHRTIDVQLDLLHAAADMKLVYRPNGDGWDSTRFGWAVLALANAILNEVS